MNMSFCGVMNMRNGQQQLTRNCVVLNASKSPPSDAIINSPFCLVCDVTHWEASAALRLAASGEDHSYVNQKCDQPMWRYIARVRPPIYRTRYSGRHMNSTKGLLFLKLWPST